MVVEIFGLPGAGKTRLSTELSQELGMTVVRLSLGGRLLYFLRVCTLFPKEVVRCVRLLLKVAPKKWYSLFMNGCIDRYARFAYARQYGGIVDKGPLQNVLSFPTHALSEVELETFIAACPKADAVVHVTADPEIRSERQKIRGRIARDQVWEQYACVNERMAISAVGRRTFVLHYPSMSVVDIVAALRAQS